MSARRPNLQLVLEGNPGHQSQERLQGGLRLPPGAPEEPAWADRFPAVRGEKRATAVNRRCREVARAEWRRVVPVLDAMGMLAKVDHQVLVDWCTCVARVDQAERQISVEGMTMQGERGMQRHGAAILAQGYRTQMRKLMVELGLTPLARDTMRGDPGGAGADEDEGSPFDV